MASLVIKFLSVATLAALVTANSCRENKLCCPGRDSSCVVQKAPLNAIIEDLSDKPCYCDHACLKLGDCCPDFKETCGVEDCMVSGWGPWSPCDAHCGAGSMTRTRHIIRAAHGGHKCPPLLQRRACHAHHNCEHAELAALKETAMLLPASLSLTRRVNETQDIRMNLRARNPDDPESNYHREYCVEFKVQKVSRACEKEDDYKALKDRETVCVKCEVAALRRALDWRCAGHGIVGHSTRFTALDGDNHCHGKWTRLNTDFSECCGQPHFIFV